MGNCCSSEQESPRRNNRKHREKRPRDQLTARLGPLEADEVEDTRGRRSLQERSHRRERPSTRGEHGRDDIELQERSGRRERPSTRGEHGGNDIELQGLPRPSQRRDPGSREASPYPSQISRPTGSTHHLSRFGPDVKPAVPFKFAASCENLIAGSVRARTPPPGGRAPADQYASSIHDLVGEPVAESSIPPVPRIASHWQHREPVAGSSTQGGISGQVGNFGPRSSVESHATVFEDSDAGGSTRSSSRSRSRQPSRDPPHSRA